ELVEKINADKFTDSEYRVLIDFKILINTINPFVEVYVAKIKQLKAENLSDSDISEELKTLTKYPRFIDFTNYWYFDKRGLYRKDNIGGVKNGNIKPLMNPLTGKDDPVPPGGYRYNEQKLNEMISENRIHFHEDGSLPTIKRYLHENMEQRPKSIMSDDQRPDYSLMASFNTPFDNPKQLSFMTRILKVIEKDCIVLDFFSGSATTAHAVMQLNAEDGGNRKFIMVQLPEPCEESSEAFKAGYKTIAEIGKERIRRAGQKMMNDKLSIMNGKKKIVNGRKKIVNGELLMVNEKAKEQQSLFGDEVNSQFTIHNSPLETDSQLDVGFRVYKTDDTNMKDVFYHPAGLKQEELFKLESNIKEDRTPEDLLTQVILDLGLELSLPIETKKMLKNTVFIVQTNALVACFDNDIDFKIVNTIAELKPFKVVFKDASFKDDKDRINVEERFKRLSPETKVTVI
ncbi:MAG: site-specific DNA-methyltransferase, partial [Candidatus Omnitrophica bacterium]|nr:site-specific DNA-methyltransferase [Candidatus Omnitrophota bacterium]